MRYRLQYSWYFNYHTIQQDSLHFVMLSCIFQPEGILPPKMSKKVLHQRAMNKRREEQSQRISKKVKAARTKSQIVSDPLPLTEVGLLNAMSGEEDRFTYFCLSIVEPLRHLPPQQSRRLCLQVLALIADAEDLFEQGSTHQGTSCGHKVPHLTSEEEVISILYYAQQRPLCSCSLVHLSFWKAGACIVLPLTLVFFPGCLELCTWWCRGCKNDWESGPNTPQGWFENAWVEPTSMAEW